MTNPVSVGVVGTSWWADAMHLPALANHPHAEIRAICGRNPNRAQMMADKWQIPQVFTDYQKMIDDAELDALLVLSSNESHYPISMAALRADLHVLCEKPVALTYAQGQEMAVLAAARNRKTMVPFTYRYMPNNRYIKALLDDGYIGKPYHLNLRYYTGFGREGGYNWRFDQGKAGSGAIGDIGSHFLYLAHWWFGEISEICCQLGRTVERAPLDPDGNSYEVADDTAMILLTFANGAQGSLHITTLAYEDTPFGQTHHAELHGSHGTLYAFNDWDTVQRVSGAHIGEGPVQEMPIPENIWLGARRDTVHNTYRDTFREQDNMTREFITAIVEGWMPEPDFRDGARIQQLIEAGIESDKKRRWISV